MKRSEFLSQLREALEHDLSAEDLKKNIDYYDEYIRDEMKKGQSEEEVVATLGDPWAIAKTIRLSADMGHPEYTSTVEEALQEDKVSNKGNAPKFLWILAIVVILVIILSMAFGIITLVIRYAFPILLFLLIVRLFTKK